MTHSFFTTIICIALLTTTTIRQVDAFSAGGPPILGLGAILFKPRNVKFIKSTQQVDEDVLNRAGRFFVDAFW